MVANEFAGAQNKSMTVDTIALPPEISYSENQFSGLQIAHQKLYLMSECRLQDKREAKLYSTNLSAIAAYLKDTNQKPIFEKVKIFGLDSLASKMQLLGQEYEGLEAFVIDNNTVYFSIETSTPSPYCYLIKGMFKHGDIYLYPYLKALLKPRKPAGSSIYNAGFEAISLINKKLYCFFEYNYFDNNYVYTVDTDFTKNNNDSVSINKMPFRITDITAIDSSHFTAINFFFKGEGADTVYRVPLSDTINHSLITKNNVYQNYCRLISINFTNGHFNWNPLWEFPAANTGFNWEGIAAWKNGYFITNDKYTPARPYASVLLYIH
jgi:hypothetical protein